MSKPEMSQAFVDFMIRSSEQGYGADDVQPQRHSNGESRLSYSDDDFCCEDVWVGGLPFSGQLTVSANDPRDPTERTAIWQMNYRGDIFDPTFSADALRGWYRRVLPHPDHEMPIRGPRLMTVGDETYALRIKGTLSDFIATERIRSDRRPRSLYVARIAGGLINRRADVEALKPIWLADQAEADA